MQHKGVQRSELQQLTAQHMQLRLRRLRLVPALLLSIGCLLDRSKCYGCRTVSAGTMSSKQLSVLAGRLRCC